MRVRLAFVVLSAIVASLVGYGIAQLSVGAEGPQRSGSAHLTTSKIRSVALAAPSTAVEIDDQSVRVDAYGSNGCTEELFNPSTLRSTRTLHVCPPGTVVAGASNLFIDPTIDHGALDLHLSWVDPVTHDSMIGPTFVRVDNWSWAHSGLPAEVDGAVFVYVLDANHPGSTGKPELFQLSATTGEISHTYAVDAGANPYLVTNDLGLWLVPGVWGGGPCAGACDLVLDHVTPTSGHLNVEHVRGSGFEWIVGSGDGLVADLLAGQRGEYSQSIIRLDGVDPRPVYETKGTLLPSPTFGFPFDVVGNQNNGFFTLSELAPGSDTSTEVGASCDGGSTIHVVKIDPDTGLQSYVGTLPAGQDDQLDCHLYQWQGAFFDGSMFVLGSPASSVGSTYRTLIRIRV